MTRSITIGLIGDRSDTVPAHHAIPPALDLAARELDVDVQHEWVPSEEVSSVERIAGFHGLWCIPGSPYRNMEGALLAIRFAREQQAERIDIRRSHRRPTLVDYRDLRMQEALVVLVDLHPGLEERAIQRTCRIVKQRIFDAPLQQQDNADAARAVIAPLACGLLSEFGSLRLIEGTRLAKFERDGRTWQDVVRGRFETGEAGNRSGTRFELVYGASGALAGVPILISYQPKWWLQVDLVLNS